MGKDNFHLKKTRNEIRRCLFMLALAGKTDVSAADLRKFMTAAGVSDLNDDSLNACCDALKGKQLHEVINAGFGKISSLSLGGGGSSGGNAGNTEAKLRLRKKRRKKSSKRKEDMD